MVELREIAFSYPQPKDRPKDVFRNFTLLIPGGSYTALMGPNGSGKSTLGKLIKGLLAPNSGQVSVAGQLLKRGEISPQVGYVFSNPENQIVSSVVEEDVAFGLENTGINPTTIALRVRESLRLVEMEEYRYHSPHLLSGGQQQKIVLAGVLAMDNEVLVLDEPTSMLDFQGRQEILDLLAKIHRQGKTILHITHSFEEALQAQDFIYLDQGQVLFFSSWDDFFTHSFPENTFQLAYPPILELIQKLRDLGYPIPPSVRSRETLQEYLLSNPPFTSRRFKV